jgi:hypothetical protein
MKNYSIVTLALEIKGQIQNLATAHAQKKSVQLSFDSLAFANKKFEAESVCSICNKGLPLYAKFFSKPVNLETLECFLADMQADDAYRALRDRFVKHESETGSESRGIFDMMAKWFDIKSIRLADKIEQDLADIMAVKNEMWGVNLEDAVLYFNPDKGTFEVSGKHLQEFKDSCISIAQADEIDNVFDAVLLGYLIERWADKYEYYSVPEIANKALDALTLKDVEINWSHFTHGKQVLPVNLDIQIIALDSKGCPVLEVASKLYHFPYRMLTSVFGRDDEFDMSALAQPNNRELLHKVVLEEIVNPRGIIEQVTDSHPLYSTIISVQERYRLKKELAEHQEQIKAN